MPPLLGVSWLCLGGPSSQAAVRPFIQSLLADPAVLHIPWPLRPLLAWYIAKRRAPKARAHYLLIGDGGSPVEPASRHQAALLADELGPGFLVRHICRHSPPRAGQVLATLAAAGVARVIALPAYPQWSDTTSGSAIDDVRAAARQFDIEITAVSSYPEAPGFIDVLAAGLLPLLGPETHVIMCAHGLPLSQIARGDPYVEEVERSAAALAKCLPEGTPWSIAYQSRLGRKAWTGPYLRDVILELAAAGVRDVVLAPLSFTCENLETLYELDQEMTALAQAAGLKSLKRAPTPGTHPAFVRELAKLCRHAAKNAGWELPNA